MPHKDPEEKRAYHRHYMRRRRAGAGRAVKPDPVKPVAPCHEQVERRTRSIDWGRPYTVEDRFPYRAYLCQDDAWFDASGNFIKPRPR